MYICVSKSVAIWLKQESSSTHASSLDSTPMSLRVVIVGDSGLQLNKRNNNIQEKDKYQIKKKIKQKT